MAPTNILRLAARRALTPQITRTTTTSLSSPARRHLSRTTIQSYPRTNAQDKDSIDTEPTEYSKSGTDSQSAQKDAAFDPSKTSPEAEKDHSGESTNSDSLDVSPANQDVSKQPAKEQSGAEKSPKDENSRQSGAGKKGGQN